MNWPTGIFGLDFSGARNAGEHIWITACEDEGNRLRVRQCRKAADYLNCPPEREATFEALRQMIPAAGSAVFGLDFPFGLPAALLDDPSWTSFVRQFPDRFETPEAFRRHCRSMSKNGEMKRRTDIQSRAPFSPYNLRIYRQTFYGIRNLLSPLLTADAVRVLPMQSRHPGKPLLMETCPASLLKQENYYQPYKGKTDREAANRRRIYQAFFSVPGVVVDDPAITAAALEDVRGDALDSLLSALIVYRQLRSPRDMPNAAAHHFDLIEGKVYY